MPNNRNNKQSKRGNGRASYRNPVDNRKFERKKKKYTPKAFAKKQVKMENPGTIENMGREEKKELVKVAKKAIKKERKAKDMHRLWAPLQQVELQTPLTPSNTAYGVDDFNSFDQFLLLAANAISDTSIFGGSAGIDPWQFRFYCITMLFAFLKRAGKMTGSLTTNLPNIEDSVKVPYFLAKYLEYLAPYRYCGSEQSSEYDYSVDLIANYLGFGPLDGLTDSTGANFNYSGYPAITVLAMRNVLQPTPNVAGTPAGTVIFINSALATPVALSTFMSTPGNLSVVSNALSSCKIPCVDFSWMFNQNGSVRAAPDGSAYCFKSGVALTNLSQGTTVSQGGILNLHHNFDPEIAMMFCLYRPDPSMPSIVSKPLPLPIYDYNLIPSGGLPSVGVAAYPFYCQIGATFVWLANRMTIFKPGTAKDTLRVKDSKVLLKTFYTRGRNVTTATFSTNIAHAYQVMQGFNDQAAQFTEVFQTGSPVNSGMFAQESQLCNNFYIMLSVCYYALQRRFNEQCVHAWNYPLHQTDPAFPQNGAQCFKQACYVESSALSLTMPALLAMAIRELGAVVDPDGVLCVPVSSYVGGPLQVLPAGGTQSSPAVTSGIGPIYWSAFGLSGSEFTNYPLANISQVNVCNPSGTTGTPFNQQLGSNTALGGQAVTLNQTFYTSTFPIGFTIPTQTLRPFFLSGEWLEIYHSLWNTFVKAVSRVNSLHKQFIEPENCSLGSAACMLSDIVISNQNAALTPLIPSNLMIPGTGPITNNLLLVRAPIVSMSSTMYLGKDKSFESLLMAWVQTLDQQVAKSTQDIMFGNQMSLAILTSAAKPVYSPVFPQGLFNVSPKSFNGMTSALGELLVKSGNPDSTFAKTKVKIEEARNQFGNLIPKDMKEAIGKIGYSHPWSAMLHQVAPNVFGKGLMVPTVTSKSLGNSVGAPDSVAANLAVVHSKSAVVSNDNEGIQKVQTDKSKHKKFDHKILKKVSEAIKKGIHTVGKGLKTAVELTNTVGQVSEGVSHVLGGM